MLLVLTNLEHSVRVLEAAFSRCPVLSQRECSIVAKAAGIKHQQVSPQRSSTAQILLTFVRRFAHGYVAALLPSLPLYSSS